MDDRSITTNFGLLRWMYGTHEALVKKLGATSSWKKVSDYVLGHAVPDANVRTLVEAKLNLPPGWTSRNNSGLLRFNEEDFLLVEAVTKLDPKTKRALLAFAHAASSEA